MQRGANHERRSKKNPDRRGPGNVPDPRRRDGSDLPGAQKHAVVHGAARAKSRNADPARARTPGRHQSRPGAGNRQDKRSDLEAQAIDRALGDLWLIGWKEIRNHWNREISIRTMQRIAQRINMPMVHVGNKPCILRETLALIKLRMQAMPAIKGK